VEEEKIYPEESIMSLKSIKNKVDYSNRRLWWNWKCDCKQTGIAMMQKFLQSITGISQQITTLKISAGFKQISQTRKIRINFYHFRSTEIWKIDVLDKLCRNI
jgi:hypothetical protein